MKRGFAILCLAALFLSASSFSYFYWVEEQLHEQDVFATIDAGKLEGKYPQEKTPTVTLILQNKEILPEGYIWEEEGREFSHKGMFYDIISLKKTIKGWELVASRDEEEAAIVAHKNNSNKEHNSFKLSKIQLVFLVPALGKQDYTYYSTKAKYAAYKNSLYNRSLNKFSPPPEAI